MSDDTLETKSIIPKRSGTPEERREYYRQQKKRWRDKNPERARASRNSWRHANLEKARAQSRAGNKRYLAKPEKKEKMRLYFQEYGKKNRDRLYVYQQTWQEKNRDKTRAYVAAYDEKHREERKLAARNRRVTDRDRVLLVERKWRKANEAYLRKKENERRTLAGIYDVDKVEMRVRLFGGACAYCGGPFEHIDHAIAVKRGGTNWPANLRPACKKCNLSKGAKDWRQWQVLL